MYNYFMLIGIVYKDFEIREVKDGIRVVNIPLVVKREFQNSNGEYESDFFNISVWENLAQIAVDRLKKGTKIGLKGRIRPTTVTLESGFKTRANQLYADRIIFFGNDDEAYNVNNIEKSDEICDEIVANDNTIIENSNEDIDNKSKKSSKKSKEVKD